MKYCTLFVHLYYDLPILVINQPCIKAQKG